MDRNIEEQALHNIQATIDTQQALISRIIPFHDGHDRLLLEAMCHYPLPLSNRTLDALLRYYLSLVDDPTAVAFIQRTLTGRIAADVALEIDDPDYLWVLLCQSVDARAIRSVVYRYVLGLDVQQVMERLGYRSRSALQTHFQQAADAISRENLPRLKDAVVWQPGSPWHSRLDDPEPVSVVEMDTFRVLTLNADDVVAEEIPPVQHIDAEAFWRAVVDADYEPGLMILVLRLGCGLAASDILERMGICTRNQDNPADLLNRRLIRLSNKMARNHYPETVKLSGILTSDAGALQARRMGDTPAPLNDRIRGLLAELSTDAITPARLEAFRIAVLDGHTTLADAALSPRPEHSGLDPQTFWYAASLCATNRQMRVLIDTELRGVTLLSLYGRQCTSD